MKVGIQVTTYYEYNVPVDDVQESMIRALAMHLYGMGDAEFIDTEGEELTGRIYAEDAETYEVYDYAESLIDDAANLIWDEDERKLRDE